MKYVFAFLVAAAVPPIVVGIMGSIASLMVTGGRTLARDVVEAILVGLGVDLVILVGFGLIALIVWLAS